MPETLAHQEAQLRFNDHTLLCPEGLTLAALLEAQGVDVNKVATAVNGEFVPRGLRASTVLKPGDTVLTFQAIVGG
ncbi:MAG: thiamine biosynthesis protein ThiS [Burkholderiales bacterium RIFCSPHIGHO2_12_FULL_67_38]|nr:MAG: thiamine biosynthesis protein ThiS [Burkholderiales bacterium RIFCSPLOWO2_02_FULL_67_64]OGB39176.1 MAG: thiamine biosynthesis protein ThiS [Burkholderiales bacterium RIFCSPHIGHO2_12_FULL_67_38]OGB82909.1 MAG: thiamine biosynthesis protein ThiS [Burkholderiales bacterium RIFCSPLOWO2_12_FULL_67_210]